MKSVKVILYALLSVILLTGCDNGNDDDSVEYVKVGDPVPAFTVSGNFGVYDSSQTDGKITLIVFFNPTCGDCQRELPKLKQVWDTLGEEADFQMVNVARGKTLEEVASDVNGDVWLSMPCYPDPNRLIYNLFAESTIPRVYVVGPDGVVKKMWVEVLEKDGKELSASEFTAIIEGYLETL